MYDRKYKVDPKYKEGDKVIVLKSAKRTKPEDGKWEFLHNADLRNYHDRLGTVLKVLPCVLGIDEYNPCYKVKFVIGHDARNKIKSHSGPTLSNISFMIFKESELIFDDEASKLLYNG